MFIDKMNRKQKRQFNKLSPDEQAPIIEAELIQKVSPVMADQISKSMIAGMNLVWENIYTSHVRMIDKLDEDENSDEWKERVNALLSEIRKQYIRVKAKEDENEK